jgi:hypothetical protein
MNDSAYILQLLQRIEEFSAGRDSIGNFETQHCDRRWNGTLYRPIVDELLIQHCPTWREEISWPDGKRFAVFLSHDVDSLQLRSRIELLRTIRQHFTHGDGASEKLRHLLSISGLRRSPQQIDIFTPWVEVEEKFGFRSTFFVFPTHVRKRHVIDNVYQWNDRIPYRGERCPARVMVRDLHSRGWDIGLHASYLSFESYDMIAEQKNEVEQLLGSNITASRHHNLHFESALTPRLLDQASIKVDSTLGFNRDVGFRAGTSYPFRMWDEQQERWLSIIEIPVVLHDGALLRPDNLDLDPENAIALCKRLIDRVIETKGVVTLLWHPESIARCGWFDVYEKVLGYIQAENGWGASARQIYEWWTAQHLNKKLETILDQFCSGQISRATPISNAASTT